MEIEFGWIGGAKLVARRGMTGATGNIYCGLHEFVEMAFLLHLLRPGDLFIDAGANIGSYTILASKVCQARTLAFEPDPLSVDSLRRNVVANDLHHLVTVLPVALGRTNGETAFTTGLGTMNRVADSRDRAVQVVPMRRLDDVCEAAAPTLLKLDVEGFEEEVLAGAARVLSASSLLAVQSELCTTKVEKVLESFDFVQREYDPFSRTLRCSSFGYPISNTLFVRDTKTVEHRVHEAPLRTVVGRQI